jgi:hypothetical protein
MSEAYATARPGPRLCVDCRHVHGGRGYGLCYETVDDEVCPCNVPRTQYVARDVTERTLSRRAAKAFAALTPGQRAWWAKWVERWQQTDMTLHEFAVESGLDERLLWRTRRSLPAARGGG